MVEVDARPTTTEPQNTNPAIYQIRPEQNFRSLGNIFQSYHLTSPQSSECENNLSVGDDGSGQTA